MYISKLVEGISEIPLIPDEVRKEARELYDEIGAEEFSKKIDAELDRQRAVRAYEVLLFTGKPISFWQNQPTKKIFPEANFLHINLTPDREKLYENCNSRFKKMLNCGAIEEVQNLMEQGAKDEWPITKTLGFYEIYDFLVGRIPQERMIEIATQKTRNYAKRQLTWFRHQLPQKHVFEDLTTALNFLKMKFSDEGIIISQKKYGENSLIIKIFSRHHGIYRGFVKSIKSSKSRVIFQIGNLVSFEFHARIEENLGSFSAADLVKSYCSKIIFEKLRLDCVMSLFSIIDSVFLERESHDNLFLMLNNFLQKITSDEADKSQFIAEYIRLELKILETIGYGIDLSSCAATESTENLVFVSPKSARAVCFSAGEKYQNKLLKLPSFLTEKKHHLATVHCLKD